MKKHTNNVTDAETVEVAQEDVNLVNANDLNDAQEKAPKAKPDYIVYLNEQIAMGKKTQKELQKEACEKFTRVTKSTIQTTLVDCKNPKYNRLARLVKKDENGCLYFVD